MFTVLHDEVGVVAQIEAQFVLIVPPGPTICAPPLIQYLQNNFGGQGHAAPPN